MVAAEGLERLATVLYTPAGIPAGLPMKVIVAGVLGLDAAKDSHDTVVLGVTGIRAEGELLTVTTCWTGPPPRLAFRKTTLGIAVSVFCACKVNALPSNAAAIASERETFAMSVKVVLESGGSVTRLGLCCVKA